MDVSSSGRTMLLLKMVACVNPVELEKLNREWDRIILRCKEIDTEENK